MAAPKRKAAWQYKILNDEQIRPALYDGRHAGHGKYFAAQGSQDLIRDAQGKPVPYRDI